MKRKNGPGRRLLTALRLLLAICFLVTVGVALRQSLVEYKEAKKAEELADIHTKDSETGIDGEDGEEKNNGEESSESRWPSESYVELSRLNKDYFGWLKVYGTSVNLPVVLGEDNEFYLHHDFYGEDSSYGTLFADCLTDREEHGNLLIYGHHMKNGSMFGSLKYFADSEFFQENQVVYWEEADGIRFGDIFAVLIVPGYEDDPDYLPVREYLGKVTGERQSKILETLKEHALQWRDDIVFYEGEWILFLMTCDYTRSNGRMLICVRCEE